MIGEYLNRLIIRKNIITKDEKLNGVSDQKKQQRNIG
jgi:hypothetical protein